MIEPPDRWPRDPTDFRRKMRQVRMEVGLSLSELGARVGLPWYALKPLEAGKGVFTEARRTRLIAALMEALRCKHARLSALLTELGERPALPHSTEPDRSR